MRSLLPALLLLACSDYGLKGGEADPDVVVDLDVSPTSVTALSCGEGAHVVTLSSVGTAAVEITALTLTGEGWTMDAVTTPVTLSAGESLDITVRGTEGTATLQIESTSPDEALITVPLTATADGPPTVRIDNPSDGAILSSGEPLELSGRVSDDVDPADLLDIVWSSDVDGTISTEWALATGETVAAWDATSRTTGPHVVVLSATDSCGQEAVATVEICQDEGYTVDELDISAWHFEGSASWSETDAWLELTPANNDLVGTAFAIDETVAGDSVDIDFRFFIGGGSGADGLSMTVLDSARMTGFLGGIGCGLGYGGDASCTAGPALPGWSIEVDTYYNEGQDPTSEDHVMLTFDGDVDDPAAWAALPEMEDAGWHQMEISVAAPHVSVAIDGVTYIDSDLAGFTAFDGYVGFTAGTGSLTNQHLIDSLEVTAHTCE